MNYPGQKSALVLWCLLPEQEKCQTTGKMRNGKEFHGDGPSGRDKPLVQRPLPLSDEVSRIMNRTREVYKERRKGKVIGDCGLRRHRA